jgi:DNA uptake protein ComE-like DNA-binding protein
MWTLGDIRKRLGLTAHLLVNQASSEKLLAAAPILGDAMAERICRERLREPFRDLADLQFRAQLGPEMVKQLSYLRLDFTS